MDEEAVVESGTGSSSDARELEILTSMLGLLQRLDSEARERILQSAATFFRVSYLKSAIPSVSPTKVPSINSEVPPPTSFSGDRTIPPKQFMLEKQPRTDVERVACLAYYLTHFRDTSHFKTLDISKLNTEAAQIKFSNPAFAVENATKRNYLVPATRGNKQLSALGEQFVQSLPDRDRAKAILEQMRPRRRARKSEHEDVEG